MSTKILVVASTFPAHEQDSVPGFVRDQMIALKQLYPAFTLHALAPHDERSRTQTHSLHEAYEEHRFHYFWPHKFEKLAGRGIMPTLQAHPAYYLLVPFLFIGEFFALWRSVRSLSPSLIYAHWFTPQAVTAYAVSKITGVPFVFTTHASDVAVWRKIPLLGRMVVRRIVRDTPKFTAVSMRSMDKLTSFFSAEEWKDISERAAVIPMGTYLEGAEVKPRQSDRNTILFMGRLAEKKGIQFLLPAFARARKSNPKLTLVIAGDGPMKDNLTRQTQELSIQDYVKFVGYVSGTKKKDYLSSASIFAVPSIITKSGDGEGMPVSLMEGMAHGKICIATPESGGDEVIEDGGNGFLVASENSEALADAILKACRLTEKEYRAMSAAAHQSAQQFAWPHIAKEYYEFMIKEFVS